MSRQCFRSSLAGIGLLLAAAAVTAAGAPAAEQQEPMVITADAMQAAQLEDRVDFSGNVTLKREGMTLTSDTAIVRYGGAKKGIREVEALGNVVVRKEGRVAHAERALYYNREEKIVLTGDARIVEGENEIGGDRITLYLRDDRSVIEGGKVLFYQEKEQRSEAAQNAQEAVPRPEERQ